jgi:hypothetical protein
MLSRNASAAPSRSRWVPSASKFSGACQRSKAAFRAGQSVASMANQAVSRPQPHAGSAGIRAAKITFCR